jgi:hypothetical protein
MALVVLFDPPQNGRYGQRRQALDVAHLSMLGEQLGDRQPCRQAALALFQCSANTLPGFTRGVGNRSRFLRGPTPGLLLMGVGPLEDLIDRQRCMAGVPAHFAPRRQQTEQRRATR